MSFTLMNKDEMTHNQFMDWALEQGINTEQKEDWYPWWECWKAGYDERERTEWNG